MLNFKEFTNEVVKMLEEKTGKTIITKNVIKNNGEERMGVALESQNGATPVVYIKEFYEDYKDGSSLDIVLDEFYETFKHGVEQSEQIGATMESLKNVDYVKANVLAKVVSLKDNSYLTDKIFTADDDLGIAYIYYIDVSVGDSGRGSCVFNDEMLDTLNISKEELHKIALENTEKYEGAVLLNMSSVIARMIGMDDKETNLLKNKNQNVEGEKMFILTNEERTNGAITMFYKNVIRDVADRLNKDIFIIPSSIHEVIIVPKEDELDDRDRLTNMLRDVNGSGSVDDNEVLSNDVFEYTRADDVLKIA